MKRRKFFILAGLGVIGVMGVLLSNDFTLRRLKNVLRSRFYPLKPNFLKSTSDFPSEGQSVSLEAVLNSRCTSDHDGDPERFHWGMFDATKKLSIEQVEKIVKLARIPRFTNHLVEIQADQNMLTFVIDNNVFGIQREWMMVESGMQQQAVGLVCAALGTGMVFRNLSKEGTSLSDTEFGTIRIKLDPMKPSYNGDFWTEMPPAGVSPWLKGNLPDPIRNGKKPLISTLSKLGTENKASKAAIDSSIGQLLWAARGRTPHLYNSRPWGMTIPTWAGKQDISNIYLISKNKLSKYINWEDGKPTHTLRNLDKTEELKTSRLQDLFLPYQGLIILCRNEDSGRALWEIGYQLLNLLLQAHGLGINYRAILLDETQRTILTNLGLNRPVAVLAG